MFVTSPSLSLPMTVPNPIHASTGDRSYAGLIFSTVPLSSSLLVEPQNTPGLLLDHFVSTTATMGPTKDLSVISEIHYAEGEEMVQKQKGGTGHDAQDMSRMGKKQQLQVSCRHALRDFWEL